MGEIAAEGKAEKRENGRV